MTLITVLDEMLDLGLMRAYKNSRDRRVTWYSLNEGKAKTERTRYKFIDLIDSMPFGRQVSDEKTVLGLSVDFEAKDDVDAFVKLEERFDEKQLQAALTFLPQAVSSLMAFIPREIGPKSFLFAVSTKELEPKGESIAEAVRSKLEELS